MESITFPVYLLSGYRSTVRRSFQRTSAEPQRPLRPEAIFETAPTPAMNIPVEGRTRIPIRSGFGRPDVQLASAPPCAASTSNIIASTSRSKSPDIIERPMITKERARTPSPSVMKRNRTEPVRSPSPKQSTVIEKETTETASRDTPTLTGTQVQKQWIQENVEIPRVNKDKAGTKTNPYKVEELQRIAKKIGVSASGTKAVLVDLILKRFKELGL